MVLYRSEIPSDHLSATTIENCLYLLEAINSDMESFLTLGHLDYLRAMSHPSENTCDWLKKYFHKLADSVAPERHQIFRNPTTLSKVDENDLPDIGTLPLELPVYYLLMEAHGVLPILDASCTEEKAFSEIDKSLTQIFRDKVVYLLPGRGGQIAQFLLNHHISHLVACTDTRYIKAFHKNAAPNFNQKITVLQTKISSIADMINKVEVPKPDIIICTNMFNISRFQSTPTKHKMETSWQDLLSQLLGLSTPQTQLVITPALDTSSIFNTAELKKNLPTSIQIKEFMTFHVAMPMASDQTYLFHTLDNRQTRFEHTP